MTPAHFALTIYQGDTYDWDFTLWQDRARTVPIDLEGVTPKAEIRDRSGGALMLALSLDVTLPNVITASLSRTDSLKLTRRSGVWDLQLTLIDGTVTTIVAGNVLVTPAVTDSA